MKILLTFWRLNESGVTANVKIILDRVSIDSDGLAPGSFRLFGVDYEVKVTPGKAGGLFIRAPRRGCS